MSDLPLRDAAAALRHSGFPGWDLPDSQKQKMLLAFERFVSTALGKIS